jgi:hypothetical protein
MGTTPTTDNSLADFFDSLVSIFITGDEVAVEAYIASQVPFLEGPIVSYFTNDVVDLLGNAIRKNLTQISSAIAIDMQSGAENGTLAQTFEALQSAKASGNVAAIAAAQQAFINAAASLAHSDGSATNVNS